MDSDGSRCEPGIDLDEMRGRPGGDQHRTRLVGEDGWFS